jgi:N-ethylmaleimide reductase
MSKTNTSFTPYTLGNTILTNRLVMAPMTRSRAIGNKPNALIAEYYRQRAGAGLIVSEGVSPSPNGLGYARMPGLFSKDQVNAWKEVTKAVHEASGKIFAQIMHAGRIGHALNLPEGARIVSASAVIATGQIWTDKEGMKDHPVPQALSLDDVAKTKAEYVQAALNAIEAGFDGIELHGANGYLLEQFLSPFSNQRTDNYGGSIENRSRFVLEVAKEVADAIGKENVGIRLSPYGVYNEMPHYPEIDATYTYLAEELNKIGITYIHLVDHSSGGAPEVPLSIKKAIREKFRNTLILSGGYTLDRAEEDLSSGFADLVAFGKPFITNPDLVERLQRNFPINNKLDASTLYTADAKGYTDYPVFQDELISA